MIKIILTSLVFSSVAHGNSLVHMNTFISTVLNKRLHKSMSIFSNQKEDKSYIYKRYNMNIWGGLSGGGVEYLYSKNSSFNLECIPGKKGLLLLGIKILV